MKRSRKWVLWVALALVAWLGWRAWSRRNRASGRPDAASAASEDPALLFDRVWLDRLPTRPTDHVQVFVAISRQRLGAFQRASQYEGRFEVFQYTRPGGRRGALDLRFPQSKREASFTYKIEACEPDPPFDLCLELSKNPWKGPRRYYGIRDRENMDAALRALETRALDRLSEARALTPLP